MFATDRAQGRRTRGSALATVLIFAVLVAGIALLTISSSGSSFTAARSRLEATKAFYVAEGGVDFCLSQMSADPLWPARAADRFPTVAGDGSFTSAWIPLGERAGDFRARITYARTNPVPSTWTDPGFPPGFQPLANVVFPARDASPSYDRILVQVTGRYNGVTRTVRANVRLEMTAFGAAIVADSVSLPGGGGSGKGGALNGLNMVFDGQGQFVHGGVRSNGGVYVDGTALDDETALAELGAFTGHAETNLYGTASEIPDFTNPGSPEQLFDFRRFEAAARAGAGSYHAGLESFATAMNAANAAGAPLEGVVFVAVDAARAGSSPKLTSSGGSLAIPGGINVEGTLVFHFTNAPDRFYKIFIETPLHVNAAPLGPGFDPADPATFATGYPPVLTAAKDPRNVDLRDAGFANFGPDDDLPALMFDNGTVDIHHETNVCGVVYGPSFIEIENKHGQRMFFNGVVIGGGGIFLQGSNAPGGPQVFVFDSGAVDSLATFRDRGKSPVISAYSIEQ